MTQSQQNSRTSIQLELAFGVKAVKLHVKFYTSNIIYISCTYLPPPSPLPKKKTHGKFRTTKSISFNPL